MQTCRLRHQFHLIHAEEMEVKTITWGGPERHPAPAQTLPWAANGGSKDSGCHLQHEGELQEAQNAIQLCSAHIWGFQVKTYGHSGICEKAEKAILFQATSEICVSCLYRLSASLLSPCTGEQAFGLSPSQYLHALIVILGKQLGQHIVVSRKHRIRGMCEVYSLKGRLIKF